jgi:hypothetical protein
MLCGFSINLWGAGTCAIVGSMPNGLPAIAPSGQPVAPVTSIVAGGSFSFSVTATDGNSACTTLNYQLQYSTSGMSGTWNNFVSGYLGTTVSPSNGLVTKTGPPFGSGAFTISGLPIALNGLYINVAVTDNSGASVSSNSISLPIVQPGWLQDSVLPTSCGAATTPQLACESFERSVLLPSGHVFAIGDGSPNIYIDTTPGVGGGLLDTWTSPNALPVTLQRPVISLLPTGGVLIAGGMIVSGPNAGTDSNVSYIYYESTNSLVHTTTAPSTQTYMNQARDSATATLLKTGQVLVTGGVSNGLVLNESEIFDPATETWTATTSMNYARYHHTATALNDGTVLVVGGNDDSDPTSAMWSAEVFNPISATWNVATIGELNAPRAYHAATLLLNGDVLITGGIGNTGAALASAEIYVPGALEFFPVAAPMKFARQQHTATLTAQANGLVLIAGGGGLGADNTYLKTSEYFDPTAGGTTANPVNGTFTATVNMQVARDRHAAVLVRDGDVVATGGTTLVSNHLMSLSEAEKFTDQNQGSAPVPGAIVSSVFNVSIGTTQTATCGQVNANGTTTETGTTFTWMLVNAIPYPGTNPATGFPNAYPNWPDTAQIKYIVGDPANYHSTPDSFEFPVSSTDVGLYCLAVSNLNIPAITSVPGAEPSLEQIEYTYIPSVTLPLTPFIVAENGSITFNATVTNGTPGGPDTFAWAYGPTATGPWTAFPAAQQGLASLTVNPALLASDREWVMVTLTDPGGIVSSNAVQLHVVGIPVITQQPVLTNVMVAGTCHSEPSAFGYYDPIFCLTSGTYQALVPLTVGPTPINHVTYNQAIQWCEGSATPAPTATLCAPNVIAPGASNGYSYQPDQSAAGVGGPTSYYAVVTDTDAPITTVTVSNVVTYTVNEEPQVTIINNTGNPTSRFPTVTNVAGGNSVMLTAVLGGADFPVAIGYDPVDFTGALGYTYEWQYENFGGVGGYVWRDFPASFLVGDGSSLLISPAQLFSDSVQIRVAVSNSTWPGYIPTPLDTSTFVAYSREDILQVDGAAANVTVAQVSPEVSDAPVTPYFGQTVELLATSSNAGLDEDITTTYTWFKSPSTTPLANGSTGIAGGCTTSTYTIGGTGNDELTINGACLQDAGTYYAVATNTLSGGTGDTVTVTAPSNNFALAINWGETTDATASDGTSVNFQRYDALSVELPYGTFWMAGGQNFNAGLLNSTVVYTPWYTPLNGPVPTPFTGANIWTPANTGTWTAEPNFLAGPHLDGTATMFLESAVPFNPYIAVIGGSDASGDGSTAIEFYDVLGQQYLPGNLPLLQPSTQHVAAMLPTGNILLAGGQNGNADTFYSNAFLFTPPVVPSAVSSPSSTPGLIASSASLSIARAASSSVTLADGRVLVLGGEDAAGIDNAVDIYDTSAVNWVNLGDPASTRYPTTLYTASGHGPASLPGSAADFFAQAKCAYHPTGVFPACMLNARLYATATLLNDGRVLIAGGLGSDGHVTNTIEIWDPVVNNHSGGFYYLGMDTAGGVAATTPTAATMTSKRMMQSAVLLQNGSVLIFGGVDDSGATLNTAEVVDPNWTSSLTTPATSLTASLNYGRAQASSTMLPNGMVLVAGGETATGTAATAEVFDALESQVEDPGTLYYAVAPPSLNGLGVAESKTSTLTPTSGYVKGTIAAPAAPAAPAVQAPIDFPTISWYYPDTAAAVDQLSLDYGLVGVFPTTYGPFTTTLTSGQENYSVYLTGGITAHYPYCIGSLVVDQYGLSAIVSTSPYIAFSSCTFNGAPVE